MYAVTHMRNSFIAIVWLPSRHSGSIHEHFAMISCLLQLMTSISTAPHLLIDTALRNAGLNNFAQLARQRVLLQGDSANLRSCIRVIRDIGVPAPLVSRGAQWLLIAMTVSSVHSLCKTSGLSCPPSVLPTHATCDVGWITS